MATESGTRRTGATADAGQSTWNLEDGLPELLCSLPRERGTLRLQLQDPPSTGDLGTPPTEGNLGGWCWVPEQEPGWGCRQGHQVPAPGSMRKELSAKPLHPPAARSRPQPPAPNTQSRTQRLSWAPGGTTEPFPTSASTRGCAAPTRMHSGAVRAPASSSTPPDGPPPGTKPYVTKAHEPKGLTPARISAPSPTPLLRDPASQELLPHQAGSLPHVTHLRLRLPVREGPPRGSGSGCLTCAEPTCFFLCKTTEFSSVRTLLCHSLMCPCTWEQCQVPVVANRYDTTKGVHSQVDYYTYAHVQAHAYVHTHMYMYTKVRAHMYT